MHFKSTNGIKTIRTGGTFAKISWEIDILYYYTQGVESDGPWTVGPLFLYLFAVNTFLINKPLLKWRKEAQFELDSIFGQKCLPLCEYAANFQPNKNVDVFSSLHFNSSLYSR